MTEKTEVNGKNPEPVVDQPMPAPASGIGSCIRCKWSSMNLQNGGNGLMSCRRQPPTFLGGLVPAGPGQMQWITAQGWPSVAPNDWCGEYTAAPERERRTVVQNESSVIASA